MPRAERPPHRRAKRQLERAASSQAARQQAPLGVYFEVKEKERTCHLTDEGVRKAEELAGVESFYTAGNMEWPHLHRQLAARRTTCISATSEYLVMPHPENGELSIIIVDEFTGRAHVRPAVVATVCTRRSKPSTRSEGVQIKQETQTLATITLQNYFRCTRSSRA